MLLVLSNSVMVLRYFCRSEDNVILCLQWLYN